MIKAVIFDYDETLVQTLASRIQAYIELAKEQYQFVLTEEKIRKAFGIPYEDFIRELFGNVDSVENIISNYEKVTPRFPNKAYSGSIEVVNELLDKYPVGILSGSRRKMLLSDMEKLGYPVQKFFCIQTGEDTKIHKPNPKVFEPILKVTEKMGIKPSEIVYVGDDVKDYEASLGAGVNYIAITNHTTAEEVFSTKNIQYISDFSELPKKIEGLMA